ncbi:MAG: hypothetical protein ACYDH6_00645 [Acidimicrobiales bacterium]
MARIAIVAVLLAALLSGCAYHGLQFVQDHRVHLVSPHESEHVTLPLTVRWTVNGYHGRYGVFFDRAPMSAGKGLLSIVSRDDPCRRRSTCPDHTWLTRHGVYITDRSSLEVDFLEDLRASHNVADRHTMDVVLLDAADHRVGEATFVREFVVERRV